MKITPLAADSMGNRSMATFVETKDCKVLIDPGANVGEFRYGLKPHPLEYWSLEKHRERIKLFAQSADIIVITHYHFDHFMPDVPDIYREKILLLKNPNQKINTSQRKRAFEFLKNTKSLSREVSYVDGRTFSFGKTRIVFSPPFVHGADEKLGFVIQVVLQEGEESFLHSSDIQGPCRNGPVDFIIGQNPRLLYLDGPLTYLQGDTDLMESLEKTIQKMQTILEKTDVERVIIDHHLLRDIQWRDRIKPLFTFASSKGILIQTAAEYRGEENNLLEARRQQLYEDNPVLP